MSYFNSFIISHLTLLSYIIYHLWNSTTCIKYKFTIPSYDKSFLFYSFFSISILKLWYLRRIFRFFGSILNILTVRLRSELRRSLFLRRNKWFRRYRTPQSIPNSNGWILIINTLSLICFKNILFCLWGFFFLLLLIL